MKKGFKFLLTSLSMLTLGLTACNGGESTIDTSNPNNKLVTSVTLDSHYEELNIGDVLQLNAEIKFRNDEEVTDITKIWTSSRPTVATVDQTGLVSVVGSGTTYVSFRAGLKMDACKIVVATPEDPITPTDPEDPGEEGTFKITLNITSRSLDVGQSFSLTATTSEITEITWSSEDDSVAMITETNDTAASIKAMGKGSTNIVATANGKSAKCHVTVTEAGGGDDRYKEYTIYFFIDYNNADPNDETGTKLLSKFKWYSDRPLSGSGQVPTVSNSQALDPAFPYFIGWSVHPIIDTKDDLWNMDKDVVGTSSYYVYLYGIWCDVPNMSY